MSGEKKIYDVPVYKNLSGTPSTPDSGFWKIYPKLGSWYILDEFATESLIATGAIAIPITTNYIPKGTGSSIGDGTWAFSGNAIYPITDGSNIGLTGTNRVGTIFLASTLDYAATLSFKEAGVEKVHISSGGNVTPLFISEIRKDTS